MGEEQKEVMDTSNLSDVWGTVANCVKKITGDVEPSKDGTLQSQINKLKKVTDIDDALSADSTNPVQNKVVKAALDSKAPLSHNHDSSYVPISHLNDGNMHLRDTSTNANTNSKDEAGGRLFLYPSGCTGIFNGNGDEGGENGIANLIIKSWYGVGFVDGCTGNGMTVGINCRTGNIKCNSVNGMRLGDVISHNITDADALTSTNFPTNGTFVPTLNFLSYWDGTFNSERASNLRYCCKGAFGDVISHDASEFMTQSNPSATGAISVNRVGDTGEYSVSLGHNCTASGNKSVALGDGNKATEAFSTVIGGSGSVASGNCAIAGGAGSTASGASSVAFGYMSTASGMSSFAANSYNIADGRNASSFGRKTTSSGIGSFACGYYTNTNTTGYNSKNTGQHSGTLFCISNGYDGGNSNAFRVTAQGKIYAQDATISTGADYAEYFEWSDGNPDAEDRVGRFVTFDTDEPEKIKFASEGDYILGIVSAIPCIIGNGDEDWRNRYVMDDFGRLIYEEIEIELQQISEKTGEMETIKDKAIVPKQNPHYDPKQMYTPRDQRKEWSAVGMFGVLAVLDDGTCKVNGYAKCGQDGIATASETGYRVIKRVNDHIVKVVLK